MSDEMPLARHEFATTLASEALDYSLAPLDVRTIDALTRYYEILSRWNARLHLVAPCAPAEFARRHVLESLFALSELPRDAHILDVGSGGGLPALPLLIARSDLRATFVEANSKKAVFLREALNETDCAPRAEVINKRFESLPSPRAGALTCRAIERFADVLPEMIAWAEHINLLLLFGGDDLRTRLPEDFFDVHALRIPRSERRFLFALRRRHAPLVNERR